MNVPVDVLINNAGVLLTDLQQRLSGTNATSNSLHPGVVATNIMRHLDFTPPAGGGDGGFRFETPAQGAATSWEVSEQLTHDHLG